MSAERLKGYRALRLLPTNQKKVMSAVSDHPERENRDTDQLGSGEMPAAEKITLPPAPRVPGEFAPQADRSSFGDWALEELLARSRKLDEIAGKLNLGAEFERFAKRLEKSFDANFGILHSAIETQGKRIAAVESGLDDVREELRREVAALRERLEQLEAKLNQQSLRG